MEPWIALLVLLATLAALVAYVALSYFHVPANKIALVNWQFPFSPKIPPGHTIAAQWEQGWWAKHFGPGHHFFEVPLSRLFASIEYRDFVQIPANKFGLVEARDGKPLSQGQVVADRIIHKPGQEKTDLADGEYFLTHGGQRGYQLDLLPPGLWAINARKKGDKTTEGKPGFLWEIEEIDPEIILAKEVGIRISNIGERPDIATEVESVGANIEGKKTTEPGESVFVLKQQYRKTAGGERVALRGILPEPLYPGTHPVNTEAYILGRVDTEPINLVFDGQTASKFGRDEENPKKPHTHIFLERKKDQEPFTITTATGHTVPLTFASIVVIPPNLAAEVVALGGVKAVIEGLVVPVILEVVRLVGSKKTLQDFVSNLADVKTDMEFAIRVAIEGMTKAQRDMHLALGISEGVAPDAEQQRKINEALKFGRTLDPTHIYPVEVSSFRLDRINYEDSPDERTRNFVDIIAQRTNAEAEIPTLEAQTAREKKRAVREAASAEADAQVQLVRSRIFLASSDDIRKAAEAVGGQDTLKGSPLSHPGITALLTSLGLLAEGKAKFLQSSAPPPPPPTAEAAPEETETPTERRRQRPDSERRSAK